MVRAKCVGTVVGPESAGVRVIYFHLVEDELVLLVMVYAKAERTSVRPKAIKRS